jgi:hypothetical protein
VLTWTYQEGNDTINISLNSKAELRKQSIKTGVKTRKIIDDAAPVASKKEYNFLNTRNKTLKG